MASWTPSVVLPVADVERVALGHRLVDDYLEVVRARCRRNTLWATVYDYAYRQSSWAAARAVWLVVRFIAAADGRA